MSTDGVSVVAITPTINKILRTLGKINEKFHMMRHFSKELSFLGLQLDTETLVLRDGFRFLMQLDEDEEIILEDLEGNLWSDASLNSRSSQLLGRKSDESIRILVRMQEDLRNFEECFASVSKDQSFDEIAYPQAHSTEINFSKNLCEKTVSSLQDFNFQLSVLRSTLQHDQLTSLQWFEWNEPNHALLENYGVISRAATKAYVALCENCSFACQHQHTAKLSLNAEVQNGGSARLIFIILPEVVERTTPTNVLSAWNYVEAVVTDYGGSKIPTSTESIYGSANRDIVNNSQKGPHSTPRYRSIRSNFLSTTKNFRPVTQFPNLGVNKRRTCGRLSTHLLKRVPEMATFESICATWLGAHPSSKARPIFPWNMELDQSLLAHRGIHKTFGHPSSYRDDVAIHKIGGSYVEITSVSLAELLQKPSQKMSIEFQLGVAYRLANAVLQFHSTPWLGNEWGIEDVCFCNAADLYSEEALETLHLDVKLRCSRAENWPSVSTMAGGNEGNSSGNTTLFKLGVALIELAYSKPLQWLKEEQDMDDFTAVLRLSSRIPPLGPSYQKIVQSCLQGRLGSGDDLLQTRFQWAFYNDVLFPLKQMLKSLETENQARDIGMRILAEGGLLVKADIIFVHGLGGGSIKTWNRSGICWPRDLLPDWMENCVRIMTWGYDSGSYANQNGLLSLAEALLKDIKMKRRNVTERQRPVVFVCHSLGGLVVKQALLQAQKCNEQDGDFGNIYACTSGIIFFGTPHRDSSYASLSQLVANVANIFFKQTHDNLWHIISGNQNALITQSKSFKSISADMLLVSIFEEQPINHAGIAIPESSGRMEGLNTTSFGIPENHIYLCKFTDSRSIHFERVACHIFKLVNRAVVLQNQKRDVILNCLRLKSTGYGCEAIEKNQMGTCSWIFENSRFSDWLQQDRGIFWISGKSGSGKSTMMKYLVDDLRARKPLGNCSIVGIFISHDTETSQKSVVGLLRAIILQILEDFRDLIPVAFPRQWKSLQQKARGLKPECSETVLWEVLLEIMDHTVIPSSIYLFIDGVDNCHGSIREVLNFIRTLVRYESINMRIKACFSSRSLSETGIEVEVMSTIRLHDHSRPDLAKYVYDKIMSHSTNMSLISSDHVSQYLLRPLIDEIVEKSSGCFLWMKLALRDITTDEIVAEPSPNFSSVLDSLQGVLQKHMVSISKEWCNKGDLSIPGCFPLIMIPRGLLEPYMDRKIRAPAEPQLGSLKAVKIQDGPVSFDKVRFHFLRRTVSELSDGEKISGIAGIWNDILRHNSTELLDVCVFQELHDLPEDEAITKAIVLFACTDNSIENHPVLKVPILKVPILKVPILTMSTSTLHGTVHSNGPCVAESMSSPYKKDAQFPYAAMTPDNCHNKAFFGLKSRMVHCQDQSDYLALICICYPDTGNQCPILVLKLLFALAWP